MKYIFNTKFVTDELRNGQLCEIVEVVNKAKDYFQHDFVKVKFDDGYVTECYRLEIVEQEL